MVLLKLHYLDLVILHDFFDNFLIEFFHVLKNLVVFEADSISEDSSKLSTDCVGDGTGIFVVVR